MAIPGSYYGDGLGQQMVQASPPAMNFEALRREYRNALSELTFNSKPIITNLTIMAQENQHASRILAQTLEEHIRSVAPPYKLYALYVLDSIIKNIGGPYIPAFGRNIVRTFLDAYTLVDPPTRQKMETLFGTWVTGLGQGPIFSRDALSTIERALQRSRPAQQVNNSMYMNPRFGGPPPPGVVPPQHAPHLMRPNYGYPSIPVVDEKAALLNDIEALLMRKNRQVLLRPNDQVLQSQVIALNQLRTLILGTGLTPDQIASTRAKLDSLFEESQTQDTSRATPPLPGVASLNSQTDLYSGQRYSTPPPLTSLFPSPQQSMFTPGNNDLISSLVQAGIIKPEMEAIQPSVMAPRPSARTSAAQAERDNIQLTNSDIQKKRDNVVYLLYGALPLQCKQCGLRFPDTENGKNENRVHLDWHFRQNRRVREGLSRGQSRAWFLTEEDWISFKDTPYEENNEGSRAGSRERSCTPNQGGRVQTTSMETDISGAELTSKYIIAPTDSEVSIQSCPICREMFASVWNEEQEDWVWMNAVNINGKVYHATCHEGAKRAALKDQLKRIQS